MAELRSAALLYGHEMTVAEADFILGQDRDPPRPRFADLVYSHGGERQPWVQARGVRVWRYTSPHEARYDSGLARDVEAAFGGRAWLCYQDGSHVCTYNTHRWLLDVTQPDLRAWLAERYDRERGAQGADGFFADNTCPGLPLEPGDTSRLLRGVAGDTASQQRANWYAAHLDLLAEMRARAPVLANTSKYATAARDCLSRGLSIFCEGVGAYLDSGTLGAWRSAFASVPPGAFAVWHIPGPITVSSLCQYLSVASPSSALACDLNYAVISTDWSPLLDLGIQQPEEAAPGPAVVAVDPLEGPGYWSGEAMVLQAPAGSYGFWRFSAPGLPGDVRFRVAVGPLGETWSVHSSGAGWFQIYVPPDGARPAPGHWTLGQHLTRLYCRRIGRHAASYRATDFGAPAKGLPVAAGPPPAGAGEEWEEVTLGPEGELQFALAETGALYTGQGRLYRLAAPAEPEPEPQPEAPEQTMPAALHAALSEVRDGIRRAQYAAELALQQAQSATQEAQAAQEALGRLLQDWAPDQRKL